MPSRILEAPPPPRSRKVPNGVRESASPLADPSSDNNADDVDMIFTPVANGRRLSDDPLAFSDLADQLHSPDATKQQSPEEAESDEESDDEDDDSKAVIHVEVRLKPESLIRPDIIVHQVAYIVEEMMITVSGGEEFSRHLWEDMPVLRDHVERIFIAETGQAQPLALKEVAVDFKVYVYKTSDEGSEIQGGMEEDNEEDRTPAASVCTLPSTEIEGLWENLIYDADIKQRLMGYMNTSLLFSEHNVDRNIISSSRLALLYGPAGTGKTSLCRALAHKLAIRYSNDRYRSGAKLIEINSHSLFSKWFSESGKLVQKLFDQVHEYLDDPGCLVIVMIDEVESIAASRASAMSGTEPGDAVRVVNAILTQLDRLKAFPNVLVLATSNLAGGIDAAFIDRADIKQYIDLPPAEAVYWILQTTLKELGKGGRRDEQLAPYGDQLLAWNDVLTTTRDASRRKERVRLASIELRKVARRCHELQLSGRFLRRLPMLAHSKFLVGKRSASLAKWMDAMARAVEDEAKTNGHIALAEGKRRRDE